MCNLQVCNCASVTAFCVLMLHTCVAHEGHRPLPTRGMEVNAETGKMLLTRDARQTLDVQTVELTSAPITRTIRAYGGLMTPWNQHAMVSSPLAGRIVSLHVVAGAAVQAGQKLAELECPALEQLQLTLRSAQIDFELSERLIKATESATRSGAIPGMRSIEAKSKMLQSQAALEIASSKWRALKLPQAALELILKNPRQEHPQRLLLASPIDGIITHMDLSVGKSVDVKEHVLEIIDPSTLWLKINVLEKDIVHVQVGQPVELSLTSRPNQPVPAVVEVVERFLDPQTHLATAWASVSNIAAEPLDLLPGMSGQVLVHAVQPERKLVVPMSAIIRDGAERFVLVEEENTAAQSTYQKQAVVFGQRSGEAMEVRGGKLFPGDRVVTRGSHELGGFFAKGVLTLNSEVARDIGLVVQPAAVSQLAKTLSIDGILDVPPTHRAIATSQLSGTIERILVDRGQAVRRGDVLAEINSQDFQDLQLALLQVELEAQLQETAVENLRMAREGVSQRQLLETESQLQQTRSRRDNVFRQLLYSGITATQIAELSQSRKLLSTLPVVAPIDGVLVGFDKFLGHVVLPNERLFEIHDLSQAQFQGFVSERDLPYLREGQSARGRLVAAPTEILSGKLARGGQWIADNDRTMSVWIELDNQPALAIQHNMLARITIDIGIVYSGLAIPCEALVREGANAYVFVRREDQTFERRLIGVGISDDSAIAVYSGLTAGELIAVRGAVELQRGYAALR